MNGVDHDGVTASSGRELQVSLQDRIGINRVGIMQHVDKAVLAHLQIHIEGVVENLVPKFTIGGIRIRQFFMIELAKFRTGDEFGVLKSLNVLQEGADVILLATGIIDIA